MEDVEDKHIRKRHSKTLLLYHVVCPVKYRRKVLTEQVVQTLITTCHEIGQRYEINYLEIGADEDRVHFLIQSVPAYGVPQIVAITKSITAKEIFCRHPDVKHMLWGGNLWTSEYYANTVGTHGNEETIRSYVKQQGGKYTQFHRGQMTLFEGLP